MSIYPPSVESIGSWIFGEARISFADNGARSVVTRLRKIGNLPDVKLVFNMHDTNPTETSG